MNETSHGLAERAYEPLALGDIEPRGWLRRQLEIQADGLSGNLDECWPDIANNQWLGGENDGWERGPYYADGLLPLAYLLEDRALIAKAETWVEAFLDGQDDDGWIGPVEHARDQGYEYDPWPRFIVLKVLSQYYEATRDERAIDAMKAFCRYLTTALDDAPLERWGRYRWADLVVSVFWLFERTGDSWLLELASTVAQQGYDWNDHFENLGGYLEPYERREDDQDLSAHNVNNAMGIKAPAVRYRLTWDEYARDGSARGVDTLDRFHGQATGLFSGDEFYGGKHPSRGTELCGVVEYMYSLETVAAIHGDARYGDRLERLAYNGLPAAFTPDMWAHQYDQQANQVICNVAQKDWFNGPGANCFLLEHFGCCTANMHQGWPKFASNLWMRNDAELATIAYAPCEVTASLDGQTVTIAEETDYPFEDRVEFTVETDAPATFALSLRIPSWVESATVTRPDGVPEAVETPETYHTIERTWSDEETVTIDFGTPIRVERRYHGSIALNRGPLTFALPIDAHWKQIGGEKPHADWELYPDEPWNYGLELDPDDSGESVEVVFNEPGDLPFSPDGAPVEVRVTGKHVPEWGLDTEFGWADTVPNGIIRTEAPSERLSLIPYGCTNLRVTEFPRVQ